METMDTTKRFEVGKTYSTRSVCDHNFVISVTIASRTARTVTTTAGKTFRPYVYDGVESIKPQGNFSMAPIVRAE